MGSLTAKAAIKQNISNLVRKELLYDIKKSKKMNFVDNLLLNIHKYAIKRGREAVIV